MIVCALTLLPLLYVCDRMRERDQRECLVCTPGLTIAEWARTVVDAPGDQFLFATPEGEPVAAGGLTRSLDLPHVRFSWLVGTPRVGVLGSALHRFTSRLHDAAVKDGVETFATLCLDDNDTTAFTWLDRLGYLPQSRHLEGAAKTPVVLWGRDGMGARHG